ncbi:MAG TPA: ATP-binding protein [Burkholderiales bacterium]|nr:ATP-binding protein [Burkholderiales bacterium]
MDNSNPGCERVWLLSEELMLTADLDGTILATNPAWARILGWGEAELQGMKYFELVHPDDLQKTIGEVARLADGTTTIRLDNRYRHKDGSYRWVSWTSVPDGQSVHAIGRALTRGTAAVAGLPEPGETGSQQQRIDAVGRFAGIIAHDFNNLLQGIAGSLELVRKLIQMGRIEQTEKFIDAAMNSVKRAATLTGRLHAFSSRRPPDPKPVDVNLVIDSMKDLVRYSLTPSVDVRLALPATWTTLCDANQLENAILELVINAREAMPDGGTIAIETSNTSMNDDDAGRADGIAAGQYVCIAVTDSGTGMSKEVIQQAFDPLFTTKATGLGTGLGLSMVSNFARQLGGYVRIYSEIGGGTAAKLYLPRHGSGD